eukprot:TRINITY_DN621_c0_g1_i2.p2 TRINITY_DN621_c0_g1~~TRINITY_DN621_c0_g1_i2.p2  ORF type:complete len:604 (-),score=141.15 TRINITY_DN621_c0_g1_i2:2665-4413(-)
MPFIAVQPAAFACAPAFRRVLHTRARATSVARRARPARASVTPSPPQSRVLTTPLFYVNASPHMGSAYPTLAADALSRFYQMTGAHVTFVTGTDEHGEKIAAAAAAATNSAAAQHTLHFCDTVSQRFRALWQRLDVRYDRFVRTTASQHQLVVREFMERVWRNGDIYKSEYDGLYCTACEEYKDAKDLLPNQLCPIHQSVCDNRKEQNYFFALSKYQQRLQHFLHNNPTFVQPPERRNEVLAWVNSGLRDFSVSRANNAWGIPVPRDSSQTIYVWFDALVGYLSALLQNDPHAGLQQLASRGWPADAHIIGKDILRFHAVYWPAMLMSAGLPLPRRVIAHGFITKDGMKMGKSLGNTLDPFHLVHTYGSDAVRYYFLKALDFGKDGDFSEQRFIDIVNADLANSLGNLLNRSLNLLKKNCAGTLPMSSAALASAKLDNDEHNILRHQAERAYDRAYACYDALDFKGACAALMAISLEANAYIDRVAPWTKFKSAHPSDIELAQRCIVNVLEASRIVAVGLNPVVPQLSRNVHDALGLRDEYERGLSWEAMRWGRLTEGMTFAKPKPLFPRLELVEQAAVASS